MRRRAEREQGAALILVVVVIAALLVVAAPFVVSMRLHEKSSRGFQGEVQARQRARGVASHAIAHLMGGHEDEERRRREAQGDTSSDPEGQDTLAEIDPPPLDDAAGLSSDLFRGTADVEVTDEQGRIELNTAGPSALANLFGATVTTAPLGWEETRALLLEDAAPFYSDGDPGTLDGYVRLGGSEFVAYRHKVGNRLEGLTRRYLFSDLRDRPEDPDVRQEYHPAGTLVQDGRGYKLAFDGLWRYVGTAREGELARFDSKAAIRRAADWEYGTARAALVLFRYGVTLKTLRGWGVSERDVLEAGVLLDGFDKSKTDEEVTPEARRARLDAERQLKRWGLDVDRLRSRAGDAGLVRLHEYLEGLDKDVRTKTLRQLREREDQLAAQAKKVERWLREELKRQVGLLAEMRNDSPHLETVGRIEFEERIRPFVTADALPGGEAWSDPQVINQTLRYDPYAFGTQVRVLDARRFRPWQLVRVERVDGGGTPELRYSVGVDQRRNRVTLFPQLDQAYEQSEAQVSTRVPVPVNVNTAPREVLMAVLTGVQGRVGQRSRGGGRAPPEFVTPTEARAVAEAIVASPGGLAEPGDLRALLLELRSSGALDDHDVDAIFRNAVDPCDPLLLRPTVGFCFGSGNVYELRAAGRVIDDAGHEAARHVYREVIRVAPARPLVWHLDSQQDFSDRLYVNGPQVRVGRPALPWLARPGRWSNLLQTRPVHLGPYGAQAWLRPSRSHAAGEGDVQPLLGREPDVPAGSAAPPTLDPNAGWINWPTPGGLAPNAPQRWDRQLDGVDLGGQSLRGTSLPTRYYELENGTLRATLGPGHLRGWFRFDSLPAAGAKSFLFDFGAGDAVDRLTCYLQDGALVLAAYGEALDELDSARLGVPPRGNELRYQPLLPFQAGNWYHVAAFWRGTERGDLALAVDGRFVGQDSLGTRLRLAIDGVQTVIEVEDASAFWTDGDPNTIDGYLRLGGFRATDLEPPTAGGGRRADRGLRTLRENGASRDLQGKDANAFCEVLAYTQVTGNRIRLAGRVVVPQGSTSLGVRDFGRGIDRRLPPGSLTLTAGASLRVPSRGSGHPYLVTYTPPQTNPQTPSTSRIMFVTAGRAHEAGVVVLPYGYSARLKNEPDPPTGAPIPPVPPLREVIRRGGRELAQPLPVNTPGTFLYPVDPAFLQLYRSQYVASRQIGAAPFDPYPQVIDGIATRIPVAWAAPYGQDTIVPGTPPTTNVVGGWPQRGIVRISTHHLNRTSGQLDATSVERVYYRGIEGPTANEPWWKLTGCVRNVENPVGRVGIGSPHHLLDTVVLESIELDGPARAGDYPQRTDLAQPRVFVSVPHPLAAPGNPTPHGTPYVEWLSVQAPLRNPGSLDNAPFVLVPARDSLDATPQGTNPGPGVVLPTTVEVFDLRRWLWRRLLQQGPPPDLTQERIGPVTLPAGGGPWPTGATQLSVQDQVPKEVLKRWEPSQARTRKGTVRRPGAATLNPPFLLPLPIDPYPGHLAGAPLIPTFAIRAQDGASQGGGLPPFAALLSGQIQFPGSNTPLQAPPGFNPADWCEVGLGDVVTVSDDQTGLAPAREERTVVHVGTTDAPGQGDPGDVGQGRAWLVALDRNVSRAFLGDQNARLAKFPVGRFQSDVAAFNQALVLGRARDPSPGDPVTDAPGVLAGKLDDLVVEGIQDGRALAYLDQPLTTQATSAGIRVPLMTGRNQGDVEDALRAGALLRLDGGEVVGVVDADAQFNPTGLTLLRGALGTGGSTLSATPGPPVSAEAPAWILPWPPVAIGDGTFAGARGAALPVRLKGVVAAGSAGRPRFHSEGRGEFHGGYLALDPGQGQPFAEVIPYVHYRPQGQRAYFQRPVDRFNRGAFRSAFGSGRQDPVQGDLLIDLPFRAHDRYQDRTESLQGVFFQASRELPGSKVFRVEWDEFLPSPFADVQLAVRLNGAPAWDAQPATGPGQSGQLYVFDDPAGDNRIELPATRVELRLYLTFRPGALQNDQWKRGPLVGGIRVHYYQRTQSLRREERVE